MEGFELGCFDGFVDGCFDGNLDGEGDLVGGLVPSPDGDADGVVVGLADSTLLGLSDG